MIQPVPYIAAMAPYARASLTVPAGLPLLSLSQNESFRPPSPLVTEAVARGMVQANLYPDADWTALRGALASLHKVPFDNILCGCGSMELILSIAFSYSGPDHAVLAPAHAYPFFRTAAQLAQARFDTAPEQEHGVSVDNLLAAIRDDTRLVFVANPGNPTGTRIPRSELLRLREALPENTLLVIDEAYGEFADHLDEPMFDLVERRDTVVLRTFSKAYGLAGLRVGWGVFPPDVSKQLKKVMNPNSISLAGQLAAEAAIDDHAYMRETCALTTQARADFTRRLRAMGFTVPASFTNFSLIHFAKPAVSQQADAALRAKGIVARAQSSAGLDSSLRITIATSAQMDRTADVLEAWANREMA